MMIYLLYEINIVSCFACSIELHYVYAHAYTDIKADHYETVADLEILRILLNNMCRKKTKRKGHILNF